MAIKPDPNRAQIDDYYKEITKLLKDGGLAFPTSAPSTRQAAQNLTHDFIKTITIDQKAQLILFLYREGLLNTLSPVIFLWDADFKNIDLTCENLRRINLTHVNLAGATLFGADLLSANLTKSIFRKADLSHINLQNADLCFADLNGANFEDCSLRGAKFIGATMPNGNLYKEEVPLEEQIIRQASKTP